MLYKRIISILLALVLLVGTVPPVTAAASETETTLDPGQVSVEGTNALGQLLTEEVQATRNASLSAGEDYESGFSVTELTFSGATATVTYDAVEEATLVVAVYTEDGLTLLNSAYETVSPEAAQATVTLSGDMPEYFYAAAYLVSTYDLAPLCASYRTMLYTRSIQDLKNSTADDFDPERLLNLDDDTTTNFAVYGERTLVVEAREGVNTVVSADDEARIYVIANADSRFTDLQPGDVVAYQYGQEEYLFAKAETVEVSGDTVTIYGGELELHDVFSHVKVEAEGDLSGATIDDSTMDAGIDYAGSGTGMSPDSDSPTAEAKFDFILREGAIDGKLSVGVKAEFTFLSVEETLYVDLVTETTLALEATMEGKVPPFTKPMGKWQIPMALGTVSLVCEPQFKVEAAIQGKVTATIGQTIGFIYDSQYGFSPVQSSPMLQLDLDAEGKIFVGFDLCPGVELVQSWLVDISAELPFGLEIEGKYALVDMELSGEERHACEDCLELTLYAKIAFTLKMEVLKSFKVDCQVAELKRALSEAYFSIDHWEFGWGKCPYQNFRVVLYVRDSQGSPVGGAAFSVAKDGVNVRNDTVNSKGAYTLYLEQGTYTIQASNGDLQRSVTERVEEACKVTITLPETPEEEPGEVPGATEPTTPGGALGNIPPRPSGTGQLSSKGTFELNGMQWAIYSYKVGENSYLSKMIITGSGEINNEVWSSAKGNFIKEDGKIGEAYKPSTGSTEIVFGNGITSIADINLGCCYTTLPSSLRVLGDEVFWNNTALTEINLPDGLTTIGSGAFMGCTNLKEIVIPGSVREIGQSAFGGSGLERLVIQEGVTELGDFAIETCTKLKSVTLPGSLKKIGRGNFSGCISLQQVNLPEGLEIMGPGCFSNARALRQIDFPASLRTIGDDCFFNCDSLESLVIPGNVTEVGIGTFASCDSLKHLTILGGMTEIWEEHFYGLPSLEQVVLGEGVRKIGNFAFSQCKKLKSVQLPKTLEVIGESAFDGSGLTEITIPGSMQEIGENAFLYCDQLAKVTVQPGVESIGEYAFQYCTALTELVLPEGLKRIELFAFFNCDSLSEVSIPKTVEHIGGQAFSSCENLETITFEGFDLNDGKDYSISIQASAFEYCPVTRLELPCIVESHYPFWNCNDLETVVIDGWTRCRDWDHKFPDSVQTIYYPYTYSLANYPGDGAENADLYYTVSVMEVLGFSAEWIPYTVDGAGNMVPMEELAYRHNRDWGDHPFDDDSFAGAANSEELLPTETEPVEPVPDETEPAQLTGFTTVELTMPDGANAFRASGTGASVRALSAGLDGSRGPAMSAPDALYSGEYSSTVTENRTVKTASFSGLVPGGEYLLLALAALDAADPLDISNLIHIDQAAASAEGTLSFDYVERQKFSVSYVMVSGPSNKDLKDAAITFPSLYAGEEERLVEPTVIYQGKLLTEGVDYVLSGDVAYSAAGTYTCYIRGIFEYTGTVKCTYTVTEYGTAPKPPAEAPVLESFCLTQDYLLLAQGGSGQLTAEIQPAELASRVEWSVEDGGEGVVSVDNGTVTALGEGTAWVIATVTDGEITLSDRCRIDVAAPIQIEDVQLSTNKLTAELYSTDYAAFDVLLQLPQNYADSAANVPQQNSVAISAARFTDEAMAELFSLVALDDRTVAIVPTEAALKDGKAVQSKYVGTVTVTVQGETYETDPLTLTVKKTLPKLKATVPAFNNFWSGQTQPITITGATVTGISCDSLPDWLSLYAGELSLTENVPAKGGSAKLTLLVETEEWAVPTEVALAVKCSYKAPGLKLSASSVQMAAADSNGVQLQLLSKDKKVSLADLGITVITAPEGYSIADFNAEDGTFTLKAGSGFPAGKINLEVIFRDTEETVSLPLTVKTASVALKLSQSSITLNSGTGDSAAVAITATPADYRLTAPDIRLEDASKQDKTNSGELNIRFDAGKLYVSTTDQTPDNAKYTLYVSTAGGKEAALKITTTNAEPTLKLKANGNLDLSFPDRKIALTTTFKNHSGGNLTAINYTVTESSGKMVLNEDSRAIQLTKEGADLFVQLRETEGINIKNTYTLNLKLTLEDGSTLESSVKIPVKQTAVNLKLSANKLTLNKAIEDKASVAITCATKDYAFSQPVWQLTDSKGNDVTGQLDITWTDGKLTVATNEATPYGGSYKLQIAPEEGAKAVTLAITVPAENKSNVTGTLKATGSLDVIRDGTALAVIPTWKNCNDAERTEELKIFCGNEDVTASFNITEEDGKYILTRAGALDHSQKYTATLTATFAGGETAEATCALKLKQGSAKLTLNAYSTTLFANDKHSRVEVFFTSADAALNGVAKVELDPKLADQFEVFDYGNGTYAIGFKDGKVPAKLTSANISLNVWLEGNETAKANATLKVKITIVQ